MLPAQMGAHLRRSADTKLRHSAGHGVGFKGISAGKIRFDIPDIRGSGYEQQNGEF